jgi:hypothetical protein
MAADDDDDNDDVVVTANAFVSPTLPNDDIDADTDDEDVKDVDTNSSADDDVRVHRSSSSRSATTSDAEAWEDAIASALRMLVVVALFAFEIDDASLLPAMLEVCDRRRCCCGVRS